MSSLILPSFSKDTPNKIGNGINVSGRNTLIKTEDGKWRVAIADEPIDAKVDGKKMFCVRIDNAGPFSCMMVGFTSMETFDSNKSAYFGNKEGFTGAGILLNNGNLYYPVDKHHNIIDFFISDKAKEIIVIFTISNNGTKKEIRFLCDGNESKSTDVSEPLQGDRLFPAVSLCNKHQRVTTIPIDQIETRTPAVDRLLCEENVSFVETKQENTKEKKAKQVATKKTKKETKPKTAKATKKKENKNNKEKKTKK
jgi:hypothetical protein